MNRLDWAQIALSLGVMLTGLYIALSKLPRREVHATTRASSSSNSPPSNCGIRSDPKKVPIRIALNNWRSGVAKSSGLVRVKATSFVNDFSVERLEQDKETLLESYARMAPDALEALCAEERHRLYRMLRLRVVVNPDRSIEVTGTLVPEFAPTETVLR